MLNSNKMTSSSSIRPFLTDQTRLDWEIKNFKYQTQAFTVNTTITEKGNSLEFPPKSEQETNSLEKGTQLD